MASRARRNHPRPPARRGGAAFRRVPATQPPVNGFVASITGPSNGASVNDRTPSVSVLGVAVLGGTVDLQIEWRRQQAMFVSGNWVPAPTYTVLVDGAESGVPVLTEPPTELDHGTWWFRVRAGDFGTGIWSDWSAQQWLDVRPVLGSVAQYIELNVGVTDPPIAGTYAYIEMNVGLDESTVVSELVTYAEMNVGTVIQPFQASEYTDFNIGPKLGTYEVAEYMDFNVVTNQVPVPHIWWVRPEQGKHGYVFNIFGQGFGQFQGQYSGKVRLGNLVCSIARWEMIPPDPVATTVTVSGKPRATASTTSIPWLALVSPTITFEAGDTIDYDMFWDTGSSRLDLFPYFVQGSAVMGYGANLLLNDTTGDPWISDQPEAYGAWHHRRFVVPTGHYLVGRAATNFGIGWYGFDAAQPFRAGSIRSFVIRRADGVVKAWITGDDNQNAPSLAYTANTGTLQSATLTQEGYQIIHGQGLDPDTITPEHGWVVAVVPSGAVSSMVRVVLEEG